MAEQGDSIATALVDVLLERGYESVVSDALTLGVADDSREILEALRNGVVPAIRAQAEAQRILTSVEMTEDVVVDGEAVDNAVRVRRDLDGTRLHALADRLQVAIDGLDSSSR